MKPKTYVILRTSWLYGHHNEKSFIHKFISNAYKCMEENRNIEVTENEYSVPTSTLAIIQYIKGVLYNNYRGIIHAVCSSKDSISRFEFAKSIACLYNKCITEYHLDKKTIDVNKIVAVRRENKLQPIISYMRTTETDLSYDWDLHLEIFIKEILGIAKNSII
jgi:dTDP-4-dehydrorhamnose reductase